MKKARSIHLFLFFLSFSVITSCDDDAVNPVSKYIGSYVISDAVIAEPFTLSTNEIGDIPVIAGINITESIQEALLGAIQCPDKSLIELREDHSMYISCDGTTDELNAGTWEEVNETTIKLNMNAAALPASGVGFALEVKNITLVGSELNGETTATLPKVMLAGMVPPPLTLADNTPDALPVSFSITLTKQ